MWVGWWEIRNNPEIYSTIAKATAWLSIPTPFLGYAILLFFLISGFCIHYPNTKPESQPSWKIYFIRRLFRIYPSYAIAVVLTSIIGYFSYRIWGDESWNINRIIALITLSQNYPPEIGQLLNNPSLWTIPLEFEFYILYPIVFLFYFKRKIQDHYNIRFLLYDSFGLLISIWNNLAFFHSHFLLAMLVTWSMACSTVS